MSLWVLLCSGVSLRSSAAFLGMTKNNTYKKFLFLGKLSSEIKLQMLFEAKELFFDNLETFEHTKCKPLSVSLMVNDKYEILDAQVAKMPAKGALARISLKKYGPRPDERHDAMEKMFENVIASLQNIPELIKSDGDQSYPKFVRKYFPGVDYEQHSRAEKERHRESLHETQTKRRRDPMFVINQRCALLRYCIRRLVRRTWCTTKKPENLQLHLDLLVVGQYLGLLPVKHKLRKAA